MVVDLHLHHEQFAVHILLYCTISCIFKFCFLAVGNMRHLGSAEFNFYVDPEAAYVLINELGPVCPVKLLTWETCTEQCALPWVSILIMNFC